MNLKALALAVLALIAFSLNSVLCRAALASHAIDPSRFTALRLTSGALLLGLWLALGGHSPRRAGSWWGALTLFGYATAFSLADVGLDAGVGATPKNHAILNSYAI